MYLLAAAGLPLPAPSISKDLSAPFPCMHCPCGCGSAEQCWKRCCCHTLAERIGWARQNQVRPPEYAIATAKTAGIDLAWLGIKSSTESSRVLPSCHEESVAHLSQRACCQQHAAIAAGREHSACHDEAPQVCDGCAKRDKERAKDTRHVVIWSALACSGQSLNWLATVPSLLDDQPKLAYNLRVTAWLGPTPSESFASVTSVPDTPPPKGA